MIKGFNKNMGTQVKKVMAFMLIGSALRDALDVKG